MTTGPIVVLGSVNADLVLRCDRLPRPGETVHGEDFQTCLLYTSDAADE